MAVDGVAGNVFWVDSLNKRIEVARTDGSSRKVSKYHCYEIVGLPALTLCNALTGDINRLFY